MAKLIEKVYGEALFSLAVEADRTAGLMEEVKLVKQVLSDNPEFAKMMQHPAIPVAEKEQIIEQVWGDKISREVTGLMVLLLKHIRTSFESPANLILSTRFLWPVSSPS